MSANETKTDQEHPEPPKLAPGGQLLAFLREFLVVVVGAVIVASLLRAFVGQMFLIPSGSMENTLQINDRVVVEKLSHVRRGQVVVFADPGGWLTGPRPVGRGPVGKALEFIGVLPDTATEHLIKRAVGMPGDHVVCCDTDGRVTVNGQPLLEDSYLYVGSDGQQAKPSAIRFDVVVPRNHIFVMGDNRAHSRDSRCHLNDAAAGAVRGDNAFVSEDLIVGRAVAVIWPIGQARRLPVPQTYASVPDGGTSSPEQAVVKAGPEANC